MSEKERSVSMPAMNEKILAKSVQLIAADGRNVGLVTREEALRMARESSLDLVLISEKEGVAQPVVKIMDWGKALYAKKKQAVTSKKKQKVIQVKELQMNPKIGEHDFQTKMKKALEFLAEGKHVKYVLIFRGREASLRDTKGAEFFDKIEASLLATYNEQVLGKEKDLKTATAWSRVYYLK